MLDKAILRLVRRSQAQKQPIRAKLGMLVGTVLGRHGPGGGRYSVNITEDAAKELAGRITSFFERERR